MGSGANLVSALLAAGAKPFTPDNLTGFKRHSFTGMKGDELAILLPAGRTERAFREALDGLSEIISSVPELELGSDVDLLFQLINVAAMLEILFTQVRHFRLQVSSLESEVGNEVFQVCVLDFFRNLAKLFNGRQDVANTHSRISDAIELLHVSQTYDRHAREFLENAAAAILQDEADIDYYEQEGESR